MIYFETSLPDLLRVHLAWSFSVGIVMKTILWGDQARHMLDLGAEITFAMIAATTNENRTGLLLSEEQAKTVHAQLVRLSGFQEMSHDVSRETSRGTRELAHRMYLVLKDMHAVGVQPRP